MLHYLSYVMPFEIIKKLLAHNLKFTNNQKQFQKFLKTLLCSLSYLMPVVESKKQLVIKIPKKKNK